jgi:hypothetical protein
VKMRPRLIFLGRGALWTPSIHSIV